MIVGKWMLILFMTLNQDVSVVNRHYFKTEAECRAAFRPIIAAEEVQGHIVFGAACQEAIKSTEWSFLP